MSSKHNTNKYNRDENDPGNYKWGIFYFNPRDNRVILPKRAKWMGWTLNFANLWTYVILAVIIGAALIIAIYQK